jgi:hypothetical protein
MSKVQTFSTHFGLQKILCLNLTKRTLQADFREG